MPPALLSCCRLQTSGPNARAATPPSRPALGSRCPSWPLQPRRFITPQGFPWLGGRAQALAYALWLAAAAAGCASGGSGAADPSARDEASAGGGGVDPRLAGDNATPELDLSALTPAQQAAWHACKEVTGQDNFVDCPVPVLCGKLGAASKTPVTLSFPPLPGQCPWTSKKHLSGPGDLDNLSRKNSVVRARVAQAQDLRPHLEVRAGEQAVICGIDITFKSLRDDGLFRYDDDLLLLFGGHSAASGIQGAALLASRSPHIPPKLLAPVPELEGVQWPLYSWAGVANEASPQSESVLYCLGRASGAADATVCALPRTERSGEFFLHLGSDTEAQLGLRAALTGNFNLGVVVTGDNNRGADCRHDGLEATVDVTYVPLPEVVVPQLKPQLI